MYSRIFDSACKVIIFSILYTPPEKQEEPETVELCTRCNIPLDEDHFCANCGAPKDIKADHDMQQHLLKSIDKNVLSEMVKNYVRAEMKKK